MEEKTEKTEFEVLFSKNVNEHVEKKNNGKVSLSYLSWSWAWAEVKKVYPNVKYEIKLFDGKPYIYDEKTGYMVFTSVTIGEVTHDMWLPVMDSHNAAMLDKPYTVKTKYSEYTVDKCTMTDINKTIMRCLTKNLAMFGLGLYIYSGEDLPEDNIEDVITELKGYIDKPFISTEQKTKINNAINEKNIDYIKSIINWCKREEQKMAG